MYLTFENGETFQLAAICLHRLLKHVCEVAVLPSEIHVSE